MERSENQRLLGADYKPSTCLQNLPQLSLKILRTSAWNENPGFLYSSTAQQEKKFLILCLGKKLELKQRFSTSLSSLQNNLKFLIFSLRPPEFAWGMSYYQLF